MGRRSLNAWLAHSRIEPGQRAQATTVARCFLRHLAKEQTAGWTNWFHLVFPGREGRMIEITLSRTRARMRMGTEPGKNCRSNFMSVFPQGHPHVCEAAMPVSYALHSRRQTHGSDIQLAAFKTNIIPA